MTHLARIRDDGDGASCSLLVLNTHLYYHPAAPHVRTLQLAVLLRQAAKELAANPGTSLLLCGDLNSTPETGVVEYLWKGVLSPSHPEWEHGYKFRWVDSRSAITAGADQPPDTVAKEPITDAGQRRGNLPVQWMESGLKWESGHEDHHHGNRSTSSTADDVAGAVAASGAAADADAGSGAGAGAGGGGGGGDASVGSDGGDGGGGGDAAGAVLKGPAVTHPFKFTMPHSLDEMTSNSSTYTMEFCGWIDYLAASNGVSVTGSVAPLPETALSAHGTTYVTSTTHLLRFLVNSRTRVGSTHLHQCPFALVASYLCHCMLTCAHYNDSSYGRYLPSAAFPSDHVPVIAMCTWDVDAEEQ